jgi:hypothetical protein
MSLKALARERLALIRLSETASETCFINPTAPATPMKHGNPQKSAENVACFTVSPPRERNGETARKRQLIEEGLQILSGMNPPRGVPAARWAEVREDALGLRRDGWSDAALDLGWDPMQLFGCSREGNPDDEGLAVQLARRRLLLLDARSAVIVDRPGCYSVFNSRPRPQAVLLWDVQA